MTGRDDYRTATPDAAAAWEADHTPDPDWAGPDVSDLTEQEAAKRARLNAQAAAALRWWAP